MRSVSLLAFLLGCITEKGGSGGGVDSPEPNDTSDDGGGGDDTGGPGPEPAFDCGPDRAALVAGVTEINQGGSLPSLIIVHGEQACPILVDEDDLSFAAAARYGAGRVLHVGHEGMLTAPMDQAGDSVVFLQNALRWAGQSDAPTVGYEPGFEDVAAYLAEQGFTVKAVGVDELSTVQVLLAMSYAERSEAEIAALQAWVQGGGGFVQGGHAWWWATSHDDVTGAYPGNLLLNDMGLTITEGTVSAGTDAVSAEALSPLLQARFALEAVAHHLDGSAALTAAEQKMAATTVRLALQYLPVTFETYFDPARALLEPLERVIPTTADPVEPNRAPLDALVVAFWSALAKGLPADELAGLELGADLPGPVDAAAPRVNKTLSLLASYAGRDGDYGYSNAGSDVWRSTGLYAAPGELVTVQVPAGWAGRGLSVRIGAMTDTLWHLDSWTRFPEVSRAYALDAAETSVASAFGGPIYLTVPGGLDLGAGDVTVEGAVEMPWFVAGETDPADWVAALSARAVPMVELQTEDFVLTVLRDEVTEDPDPTALMAFWQAVLDADADLAAISRERVRAERFVIERQISAGWMHSGYPLMGYDYGGPMTDLSFLGTQGDWGAFHELGHNHQWMPAVLPGNTETTCNLWSVYVMEQVVGVDRGAAHSAIAPAAREATVQAYLDGGRDFWGDWSVWTALETWLQLQEAFGWELFTEVQAVYLAMPEGERPYDDQDKIDRFVLESSYVAGFDLTDFYDAWGFPISDSTRATLGALPMWTEHPMAGR
jgi:hypothetical protein